MTHTRARRAKSDVTYAHPERSRERRGPVTPQSSARHQRSNTSEQHRSQARGTEDHSMAQSNYKRDPTANNIHSGPSTSRASTSNLLATEYPLGKGGFSIERIRAAGLANQWADLDIERGKDIVVKHPRCKQWLPEHFGLLSERALTARVEIINKFIDNHGTERLLYLPDGTYCITETRIYRPIGLNDYAIDALDKAQRQHRTTYELTREQKEINKQLVKGSIKEAQLEPLQGKTNGERRTSQGSSSTANAPQQTSDEELEDLLEAVKKAQEFERRAFQRQFYGVPMESIYEEVE